MSIHLVCTMSQKLGVHVPRAFTLPVPQL